MLRQFVLRRRPRINHLTSVTAGPDQQLGSDDTRRPKILIRSRSPVSRLPFPCASLAKPNTNSSCLNSSTHDPHTDQPLNRFTGRRGIICIHRLTVQSLTQVQPLLANNFPLEMKYRPFTIRHHISAVVSPPVANRTGLHTHLVRATRLVRLMDICGRG